MRADEHVHVFGEGARVKASFDAPDMLRDFYERVHTLPISEDGNVNFAVGASLLGVTPIVDVISADFLYRCADSIINTAAKMAATRSTERHTIVIRAETLLGGPTTGQRPEAMFCHVPGINVVVPSTPHDSYGLMATALETPGVTLFLEDRMIEDAGPWHDDDLHVGPIVPFGVIKVRPLPMTAKVRKMPVVTVLTYGVMRQRVERCLGEWLEAWKGDLYVEPYYAVDLLDLRSLSPVDYDYLLNGRYGLGRTGRLLIVEPDIAEYGIGAEIAATVAERALHVRVKRLGSKNKVTPAAPSLVKAMLPSDDDIKGALDALVTK